MASVKIKRMKIMRIINDNALRGRLSENDLTQKFIAQNICDTKYSRFTVVVMYNVGRCQKMHNYCQPKILQISRKVH